MTATDLSRARRGLTPFAALLCLLLSASCAVFADEEAPKKLRLVSFAIPIMVEDQHHGAIIELTHAVARQAGIELEISIEPPLRAQRYFSEGKFDGIFPALEIYFPYHPYQRTRRLITHKRDFIFSNIKQPVYRSLSELKGKRVGVTRGYAYPQKMMQGLGIIMDPADSDEANAKRLSLGRVDAFIVEERTGLKAFFDSHVHKKIHYCANCPILESEVFYAFADTPEGKQWAEQFDRALAELEAAGTHAEIFSRAAKFLYLRDLMSRLQNDDSKEAY